MDTVRNSSRREVMFSPACVKNFVKRRGLHTSMHWAGGCLLLVPGRISASGPGSVTPWADNPLEQGCARCPNFGCFVSSRC